ncbi:unnamed protein product [Diatraea saccharalis]|uniref:Guanylate cyclase domain-containing protein n=1 Tax=Diatraea saccharalis TaxID=40085 RepID=A0A9N9RBZ9_9NEOP|nr:unnamed protein product [Diatraea saccharalis]
MNFLGRRSRKTSVNIAKSPLKWQQNRKSSRREFYEKEDSDDDDPHYKEIKDWVDEFFERKSESAEIDPEDMEVILTRKQTLILSTLVPDELLLMEKFDTMEPKRFVGVLLMADVSGYTALSERYNNAGKGGTYRLTVTLNTYLGSLIELIYSHGGDILKFAGDAFLALWKTDKRTFLCHTIHTVITCALIIQHSYASYETDVKVNLKVKLAISAGNLIFAPIGTGIDMNYIIFGLPVLEAKAAESVCDSGEVKLAATAWGHCYSRNYDHIVHEDGHVTIKAILYDPREKDVTKPFMGFGPLMNQLKRFNAENYPDYIWDSPDNLNPADVIHRNEILSHRKAILHAEENNIGSEIRKFIIRPVLTQVDAHQPLEYLTEMRQVSVLFVTLKPRDCPSLQLVTIINNSYEITCEIVYKSMGCVNKIILFDKDVMILVIFGLRGFKHESEAHAALKCAYSVKKSVSALDGVVEVSIGVTTGQVYCGVVGHPLRREFTVIGAVVNKAARLMCGFRNKITCDEATFIKSKMSSNGFTLQPQIELKGIIQPGKIYEYSEEIRVKALFDIPMTPPLLNRYDELEYFDNWLNNSHPSYRDFDALLLVGDPRIGKTRLLEWMSREAQKRAYKTCFLSLTTVHSATPYLALSQIINQILGLQEPITGFTKEENIIKLLKVYSEDLCYLNNIIKVRFAYHEGIDFQNEQKKKEKAHKIFLKLIQSVNENYVIFLDDLQNLDASSWEFICTMFNGLKIFIVMSVVRGKFDSIRGWLYNVFINNNIRKILLGPLSSGFIAPLACQILDVDAVPSDLCNALRMKCNGMPGMIENFIIHLFSSGALEIQKINADDLKNWTHEDLQFPDEKFLHPQALNTKDQSALDQLINEDASEEIAICIVIHKEELDAIKDIQNIDALVMIQIDSLTPYQQLLLKIASVIGNVLSRDLLENIMYENDTLMTAKAIKRLFDMRVLACANVLRLRDTNLVCDCYFDDDEERNENLPKYAFCKVMKFRNKNTRKTCYELLPMNQKKEFHSRIVQHLENNEHKCTDCGGKLIVVRSSMNFQRESIDNNLYCTTSQNSSSISSDDEINVDNTNLQPLTTSSQEIFKMTRSDSHNECRTIPECTTRSMSETVPGNSIQSNIDRSRITSILKMRMDDESIISNKTRKRVTMSNVHNQTRNTIDSSRSNMKVFNFLRPVVEASTFSDWHDIGVIDSQDDLVPDKSSKKLFKIRIEKRISSTNITKCTCSELKIMIYEQLIHHAIQAEMKLKGIGFIITYCYLNLLNNNYDVILPQLETAELMCCEKKNQETEINIFEKRRCLGRIYSIRAAVLLMTDKLVAARIEIEKATRIYHINLHNVTEYFRLRSIVSAIKRKNNRHNEMIMKSDSVFCLNVATQLYSLIGEDKISRISAFRALELIQNFDCKVIDICDALTNAFEVEIEREAIESMAEIERLARQLLERLPRAIQIEELFAVGKLFVAIFRERMICAQLAAAIRAGFRTITISRFLQADSVTIDIIPDLFYVLLARRRIEEAIDILQLILQISECHSTHDCETWYYALCIDMILDAGFQLESPYEISRFAEYALDRGKAAGPSRRRLVVGLWTYWLRSDFERKSKRYESEALSWVNNTNDDGSLTTLISALRLADGMLESLAKKVDDLRKVSYDFNFRIYWVGTKVMRHTRKIYNISFLKSIFSIIF